VTEIDWNSYCMILTVEEECSSQLPWVLRSCPWNLARGAGKWYYNLPHIVGHEMVHTFMDLNMNKFDWSISFNSLHWLCLVLEENVQNI
jgi:hypothetical protein